MDNTNSQTKGEILRCLHIEILRAQGLAHGGPIFSEERASNPLSQTLSAHYVLVPIKVSCIGSPLNQLEFSMLPLGVILFFINQSQWEYDLLETCINSFCL